MDLFDLDEATREYMLEEAQLDIETGSLYMSPRLSPSGRESYRSLLLDAIANGTPSTLAHELQTHSRLNEREEYQRSGKTHVRAVPRNAADTLAEGEFNRFYMRGLCARSIEEELGDLEVYRAKAVASPRSASTAILGSKVDPYALLDDLRSNPGVDAALGDC